MPSSPPTCRPSAATGAELRAVRTAGLSPDSVTVRVRSAAWPRAGARGPELGQRRRRKLHLQQRDRLPARRGAVASCICTDVLGLPGPSGEVPATARFVRNVAIGCPFVFLAWGQQAVRARGRRPERVRRERHAAHSVAASTNIAVQISQHNVLAGTHAPGDRLSDRSRSGDDDDLAHEESPIAKAGEGNPSGISKKQHGSAGGRAARQPDAECSGMSLRDLVERRQQKG
jgi:hypothetical protein